MELLIDAALPDLRVALAERGEVVASAIERGGRAESVEPLLRRVLESAKAELSDVRAVLVSRGPGSFTGLRVALAFAQGFAFGAEGCVLRAATLFELLALHARKMGASGRGAILVPARRGWFYAAAADLPDGGVRISDERMVPEEEAAGARKEGEWILLPDYVPAAAALPGALTFGHDDLLLDAAAPFVSGFPEIDPAAGVSPDYIEPPQAKPGARRGLGAEGGAK